MQLHQFVPQSFREEGEVNQMTKKSKVQLINETSLTGPSAYTLRGLGSMQVQIIMNAMEDIISEAPLKNYDARTRAWVKIKKEACQEILKAIPSKSLWG
jgi:hypothetical protein